MFLSRRPDRIDWLKKVPLFSGLSGRDLDLIARQTDVVKADAGKVLTRQGALGEEFLLIVDGSARVERDGKPSDQPAHIARQCGEVASGQLLKLCSRLLLPTELAMYGGESRPPADSYDPVWSPDGTQVAYVVRGEDSPSVYVANADGSGQPRKLTDGDNPSWSPDGERIAFTR